MKHAERDNERSGRQDLIAESSHEEEVPVDHIKVGSYYEIDHSKLPPTSPVQLQMVKIVMVCGKNDRLISVRYPSIFTLKSYFRSASSGTTTKIQKGTAQKINPALDEKYSMVNRVAAFVLFRNIKSDEFDKFCGSMSFWAAGQSSGIGTMPRVVTRSLVSAGRISGSVDDGDGTELMVYQRMGMNSYNTTGNCLSALKSGEVARWGKRLRVRYVSKSDNNKTTVDDGNDPGPIVITPPNEDKGVVGDEQLLLKEVEQFSNEEYERKNESEASEEEKVEDVKEEDNEDDNKAASDEDVKPKIPLRRNMKRKCKVVCYNQQSRVHKKPKRETTVRKVGLTHGSKRRGHKESINRWSAERYKLAEENMLKIMKEQGAILEKPMLRHKLRDEARKVIGDTGLLDHLLKHMAGKVAPGGEERFRRCHNADGAMEYWLESADLVEIRKMAGVSDPYWKPPPGWKLGDNPSQDHPVCAVEIKQLKEEVDKLKRDINELQLMKVQAETDTVATTPLSCVSDQNLISDLDVLPLKEVHGDLVKRKFRLEEQIIKVSQYLTEMEEEMDKLSKVEKASKAGSEGTDGCLTLGSEKNEAVDQGNNVRKASPAEEAAPATKAEEKASKIERLRSGFSICKPQGSFKWPNMAAAGAVSPMPYSCSSSISSSSSQLMSPTKSLEYILAAQTPTSVSSTATKSPFLPLTQPTLTRPVKPLARRLSAAGAAMNPISTPSSYSPIITDFRYAALPAAANNYHLNNITEHYGDIAITPSIYGHTQNHAMIHLDFAPKSSSHVSTSPRLAAETSRLVAYANEKQHMKRISYSADTSPVAVTHTWVPIPIPEYLLRKSN